MLPRCVSELVVIIAGVVSTKLAVIKEVPTSGVVVVLIVRIK